MAVRHPCLLQPRLHSPLQPRHLSSFTKNKRKYKLKHQRKNQRCLQWRRPLTKMDSNLWKSTNSLLRYRPRATYELAIDCYVKRKDLEILEDVCWNFRATLWYSLILHVNVSWFALHKYYVIPTACSLIQLCILALETLSGKAKFNISMNIMKCLIVFQDCLLQYLFYYF